MPLLWLARHSNSGEPAASRHKSGASCKGRSHAQLQSSHLLMNDVCLVLTRKSGSQLIPALLTHSTQFQRKQKQVLFILSPEKKVLLWYFTLDFYQNSTRYCYKCTSAPWIVNCVTSEWGSGLNLLLKNQNKIAKYLPSQSSGTDSMHPKQGARAQSLVRELDPMCPN